MEATLDTTNDYIIKGSSAKTLSKVLMGVGMAGFILALLMAGLNKDGGMKHFMFSYLVSFTYIASITIGGWFFVMIAHLATYKTGTAFRRLNEHVMMMMPVVVIMFIPIFFFMKDLFPWVDLTSLTGHDRELVAKKTPYLNQNFFIVRQIIYAVIWLYLTSRFYKLSLLIDQTRDVKYKLKARSLAAPGTLIFAITVTLAAIDWLMSLDPKWFSTMWGVYFFAGSLLAIISTLIIMCVVARQTGATGNAITIEHIHDLGKYLFAFVVFWAYIGFSQFMLIWMANIPEETLWFAHRWHGGWKPFSYFLIFGHFVVPFLFLLSRTTKRFPVTIFAGAIWILFVHYFDVYWMIMPNLDSHHVPFSIVDLALFVGMLSLYIGLLIRRMHGRPLVPVGDPHLPDSIHFHNV